MNWLQIYRERLRSAEDAVQSVTSGERIYIGAGCAVPHTLVDALVGRAEELHDVEIIHHLTVGEAPYLRPEMEGHFRTSDFFVAANTRDAVNEGRADYVPVHLHDMPRLFREQRIALDAAFVVLSPPDEHGFCSFGIEVGVTKPAALAARRIVAEVNRQMPRTLGDSFIHVSKVHTFVEVDRELDEFHGTEATGIDRQIGRHIADLIDDGACIQLGIGGIPDAVLGFLDGKKDLGVHTEMFTEALPALIASGIVTGERKNFHPGKVVAGFVLGTREVYDFVHDNAQVEFHPTDYVNNPVNVARNDRMVAVNSALQVDLTGQICADSIGELIYSGFGGQADFMRGAALSQGGLPITALPATAVDGSVSRIVPNLDLGAGVVITRADAHAVVTENGVAHMFGRNVRERARALIEIADSRFQENLERAARQRGIFGRLWPTTRPEA
ncbi:MAG: acetyl-CoA hydrolase/transferase C-terminal domain-containing protein [Candidatus Krumholzibacteriia bacterium]